MGNISMIGPRGSGKTTYLAALSYWHQHIALKKNGRKVTITPTNENARKLVETTEKSIKDNLPLEPTRMADIGSALNLPYYLFKIEYRKQEINLTVKDYPGDFFHSIVEPHLVADPTIHQQYIKDCLTNVAGCLIILTAWEPGIDRSYSQVMNKLVDLIGQNNKLAEFKLAVTMSKCERGEIWPGRIDPEIDLFPVHLPKTFSTLRRRVPRKNLKFFAISTFGVLDRQDPRPNRRDLLSKGEPGAVLREPDNWQPYNLLEPLFWLNT